MNQQKAITNRAKAFLQQYRIALIYKRHLLMQDDCAMKDAEIAKANKTIERVYGVITQMPNPKHRDLLMMRYVNGWSWPRCIIEMQSYGYSERSTYEMHGRALQIVDKILNDS